MGFAIEDARGGAGPQGGMSQPGTKRRAGARHAPCSWPCTAEAPIQAPDRKVTAMVTTTVKSFGQRKIPGGGDPFDGSWRIKIGDRVYGPYSGHQLCAFKAEGRLVAHSMVSRERGAPPEQQWHTAASDTVLGSLFRVSEQATPVFGQRNEPGGSKFALIFDLKGGNYAPLEAAIAGLGRAYRLSQSVWLLSGTHTVGGLRNHLGQLLGKADTMLVIDSTHGRTGGFNMGPEADAHIRHVWKDVE